MRLQSLFVETVLRGRINKDAYYHYTRTKCIRLLHYRLFRRRSLHRVFRSPCASDAQREYLRERCPSVCLPFLLFSSNPLHIAYLNSNPENYFADTHDTTESEADHTIIPRKKKNTHTSASRSLLTSPPSSHGTPNKSSSTCPLRGLHQTPRTRLSFGIL